MSTQYDQIVAAASAVGLQVRGAFHADERDQVPALASGAACATLVLLGNAGPVMWEAFSASAQCDTAPDPLNRWSEAVTGPLADALGADALYPFTGPPWHPFQRWARRADVVWPSPIGPLIHAEYGLWHAYRSALAFAERFELSVRAPASSPCESCAAQPSLHTCPERAFSATGYDVDACAAHLRSVAGADCLHEGCRARRACPAGADFVYAPAQAGFHMQAFLKARKRA